MIVNEEVPRFPAWFEALNPGAVAGTTAALSSLRTLLGDGTPLPVAESRPPYHVVAGGAGIREYGDLKARFERGTVEYESQGNSVERAVDNSVSWTRSARADFASAVRNMNSTMATVVPPDQASIIAAAGTALARAREVVVDVMQKPVAMPKMTPMRGPKVVDGGVLEGIGGLILGAIVVAGILDILRRGGGNFPGIGGATDIGEALGGIFNSDDANGEDAPKPTTPDYDRILDDWRKLAPGDNQRVRTLPTEEEIRKWYDEHTRGAEEVGKPDSYESWRRLPDGTLVKIRGDSRSGGVTVEIDPPPKTPGKTRKIHLPSKPGDE